jgi:hypothetical protein
MTETTLGGELDAPGKIVDGLGRLTNKERASSRKNRSLSGPAIHKRWCDTQTSESCSLLNMLRASMGIAETGCDRNRFVTSVIYDCPGEIRPVEPSKLLLSRLESGGADGDRTHDLLTASQALSQAELQPQMDGQAGSNQRRNDPRSEADSMSRILRCQRD